MVGVEQDDTLMVHSQLFSLGKIESAINKSFFFNSFIASLMESVGPDGTIIFPTFTIKDFCGKGYFSIEETKSRTGVLSEEARKRSDALRIPHPIYSVAIIGKNKERFLSADMNKCFGKGSFFDLLHQENLESGRVKFLTIGIDCPPSAITYVHHIEKVMRVSYRYDKKFRGTIAQSGKECPIEVEMFVRDLDTDVAYDGDACWKLWKDKGIASVQKLGDSFLCLMNESDIHNVTTVAIKEKEDFLCVGGYCKTV
ncbi:MAG: AAC(3) family N-acetyltransferase [Maribacter sp.]|nr:AAC(3) family N-acetyltransferase [Maribacter sp.]